MSKFIIYVELKMDVFSHGTGNTFHLMWMCTDNWIKKVKIKWEYILVEQVKLLLLHTYRFWEWKKVQNRVLERNACVFFCLKLTAPSTFYRYLPLHHGSRSLMDWSQSSPSLHHLPIYTLTAIFSKQASERANKQQKTQCLDKSARYLWDRHSGTITSCKIYY